MTTIDAREYFSSIEFHFVEVQARNCGIEASTLVTTEG